MARTFREDEAIEIVVDGHPRHICPDCTGHKQGDVEKVYDCKNVFVRNGEDVGQCCCYSEEHGIRDETF